MTQSNIQWRRLAGIMAVQSSITLAWVIYSLYLPDLLIKLGFAKTLAGTLLIIEHGLEAAIEPIFGGLSDRSQGEIGSRFPWISLGVVLAASFFIALPIIVFYVPSGSIWRWIFPAIAVLWASAMAIFRSPVVTLLGQISPQPQLPIAASGLTLAQQLVRAVRFSAYGLILSWGPFFAFALGSCVILGAATYLRKVMPPPLPQPRAKNLTPKRLPLISPRNLATIVGTGIAIGWGLRFLFATLGPIFATQLGSDRVSSGMLGFSLLLAFTALPAGALASKIGNAKAMLGGLVMTAILLVAISFNSSMILLAIGLLLMSFTFSTVLNGMVPFVLDLVPEQRAGLGIGSYFGAFSGAISFFDLFFAGLKTLSLKASFGAIALLLAAVLVAIAQKYKLNGDR